jgi:cyanate permease
MPSIVAAVLWWVVAAMHSDPLAEKGPVPRYSLAVREVLSSGNAWLVAILLFLHNFFIYTWIGWAPLMIRQTGASTELAGVISSLALWIAIPVALLVPRIAFRLGVRKPFLWGPGIVMALAAVAAIYNTLLLSWFLMLAVGVANSIRFPTILALPVEMTPKETVGMASGLMISIGYTGAIIGPLLGGYILDLTASLKVCMMMLIAVSIGTAFVSLILPETGRRMGKSSEFVISSS